ncbi:hypothetical protein KFL_001110150 [Klebsormidium nitens]|uniref:F-box domain-containing protein n=1 Tax=Klebsormidium nitens TaxID=105231 RepID=A0A1Y1HZ18_KLENI|nr:hypothetical protein KFL_001110150 [Klebsormidium nitens]|eukprot:GAQ82439.1 hypothetical protein KFL_001110150 [Klebsormidium nitens]
METLPSDVLLVIVHKLAAQDPLALLTSACAIKAFLRVTEDTPGVWKEVFYGSRLGQERAQNDKLLDGNPELNAEVESLGGFKVLVAARYAEKLATASTRVEQSQAKRRCLGSCDAVQLQPVFTNEHFVEALEKERGRRRATPGLLGKKGLCGKVSVEVYELQPHNSGGEAYAVARLWRGPLRSWIHLTYKEVSYGFNDQLLPACPPEESEESLKASVTVGQRPTSDGEGRRWKNLVHKVQLKGSVDESEFCCPTCESDWSFEKLTLAVELRTAS